MGYVRGRALRMPKLPPVATTISIWVDRPDSAPDSFVDQVARDLERRLGVPRVRRYLSKPLRISRPTREQRQLNDFLAIDTTPARAARLVERLDGLPRLRTVYVEGGPRPPPGPPYEPPAEAAQYLEHAPIGINARWAWANGADSVLQKIGFVDLEQGWDTHNADLSNAGVETPPFWGRDFLFHGHGAGVLGTVVGAKNGAGLVGVAPGSRTRLTSQWRPDGSFSTMEAVARTLDATSPPMKAGDVLLLEATVKCRCGDEIQDGPVEIEAGVRQAIISCVQAGIVVVACAGNGGVDLDACTNKEGQVLNRHNPGQFKDSGAIMVAAATSGNTHTRCSFSNYGSRVDCYAWGEDIDMCGDGQTGGMTYSQGFGGTSGAGAIVAGAALLLQAWAKAHRPKPFLPSEVRKLLSDPILNTPATPEPPDAPGGPAPVRPIGVMPNLRKIIEHLQANG